jgi:hypothetical protein
MAGAVVLEQHYPAARCLRRRRASSFEFILRIDEDPLVIKRLPDKFAEFVDDAQSAELQMREARCGFCR